MRTVTVAEAAERLEELVERAAAERVTITRDGEPAAVLIAADELESIEETLFWLNEPGTLEAVAEARKALGKGGL